MIERFVLLAVFLLCAFSSAFPAPAMAPGGESAPTTGTAQLKLVRFENPDGLQLDVWVNGRRVGFTPTEARLAPGVHRLTLSAEMMVPVVSEIQITDKRKQDLSLQVSPLTRDNYEQAAAQVMENIIKNAKDPSMYLMALFLASDVDEGMELLRRAEDVLVNDPVLETLRARVLLTAGELEKAREASDRAVQSHPSLAYAWRVRSEILRKQRQFADALEAAEKAVELEPACWLNYRSRAHAHELLGNFRQQNKDREDAAKMYAGMRERAAAQQQKTEAVSVARPRR